MVAPATAAYDAALAEWTTTHTLLVKDLEDKIAASTTAQNAVSAASVDLPDDEVDALENTLKRTQTDVDAARKEYRQSAKKKPKLDSETSSS